MIKVLPSTNPCAEDKLIEYAKQLDKHNVEYIHCDVMDGNFVENTCLSVEVVRGILHNSNMLLDIHLMVSDIVGAVEEYSSLNPSIITIHIEAIKGRGQFNKIKKILKNKDIMLGLSIKPTTPISALDNYLDDIDLVLIMSVEPGASGQPFIEGTLDRIKEVKEKIKDREIIVEVDGGINLNNYKKVIKSGGEFLVIGSAFYNEKNKALLLNTIDKHYTK